MTLSELVQNFFTYCAGIIYAPNVICGRASSPAQPCFLRSKKINTFLDIMKT